MAGGCCVPVKAPMSRGRQMKAPRMVRPLTSDSEDDLKVSLDADFLGSAPLASRNATCWRQFEIN
jgi:hypothetical protein